MNNDTRPYLFLVSCDGFAISEVTLTSHISKIEFVVDGVYQLRLIDIAVWLTIQNIGNGVKQCRLTSTIGSYNNCSLVLIKLDFRVLVTE